MCAPVVPSAVAPRHFEIVTKSLELPQTGFLRGNHGYARNMALTERQLLDALSRTPFVDSAELVKQLS